MGVILATTAGLSIWIMLWSIGAKAFDAFLITLLIVLVASAGRIIAPFLPGNRE
jgi:hypothetical protein